MGDLKLQPQRDKIRSGVETKTVLISPVLGYIAEIELNIDFQPNFAYWLIIDHRTGGVSGTIHGRKNNESRITDIEISFSRITKISTLLSCSYATNSV